MTPPKPSNGYGERLAFWRVWNIRESCRSTMWAFCRTADYMAPEQRAAGSVDARADVYSLGCLLRTACGQGPRALQSIVERATESDPQRRYQTAAAMAGDVARFLDHLPVSAHRESWVE